MIGFMPEIYPDELLYSRFTRYYERLTIKSQEEK